MTIMAFDYGFTRTGVAIATGDEVKPLQTINTSEFWNKLPELILLHQPTKLVVGLPRNLNGESTKQTIAAKKFGQELERQSGLSVDLQDEAMSTQRALERLGKNVTIADRKKLADQIAAQVILEDYLANNQDEPNQ